MARNTLLSSLLSMLKGQLGDSLTVGTAKDALYYQLLSDKQKWLAAEYDFPYLECRYNVTVPSLSRYLTIPTTDDSGDTTTLNQERPVLVETFFNTYWRELSYGIGAREYNYLNSDIAGRVADPIRRWRWRSDTQFEIWPVNSVAQTIRFTGQRQLNALVVPTDRADLDDLLIVLGVAAEQLMRSKQADAQVKQALFVERLRAIRGSYPTQPQGILFGRYDQEIEPRTRYLMIAGNNAGGGTDLNIYGEYALGNGVQSGTVTFASPLSATPTRVTSLLVRKPVNGLMIQAYDIDGTLSTTGFDFDLDGITDQLGYTLVYTVQP